MLKRKIMSAAAALTLCLSAAVLPTAGWFGRSCKNGTSCITADTSQKCSSRKTTCSNDKCSDKTDCFKVISEILKRFGCKTCK